MSGSPVRGRIKAPVAGFQSSLKLVESAEIQDLAHRRIGRDDEPGSRFLEENVQDSALFLDLEVRLLVFLARNQMPLQPVERRFGRAPELLFILHGPSVASSFC